ncbi:replication protein P [Enterobacter hormaechei]|uniref:replication protein P n=1 Tax=Enterobacter hormaechei TaxID=158836 RepID=UPI003CC5AF2C
MKSLSEQMVSIDRENFARIARGMPELPDAQDTPAEQTAEIFNALFSALRAAFPASVHSFSDQSEFDELRRQWALAFRENGITTMEQVNAGLRIARRQERPFLPSPGQFIAWCREGHGALGITVDDVMSEYWRWRKLVFRYRIFRNYIRIESKQRGT